MIPSDESLSAADGPSSAILSSCNDFTTDASLLELAAVVTERSSVLPVFFNAPFFGGLLLFNPIFDYVLLSEGQWWNKR